MTHYYSGSVRFYSTKKTNASLTAEKMPNQQIDIIMQRLEIVNRILIRFSVSLVVLVIFVLGGQYMHTQEQQQLANMIHERARSLEEIAKALETSENSPTPREKLKTWFREFFKNSNSNPADMSLIVGGSIFGLVGLFYNTVCNFVENVMDVGNGVMELMNKLVEIIKSSNICAQLAVILKLKELKEWFSKLLEKIKKRGETDVESDDEDLFQKKKRMPIIRVIREDEKRPIMDAVKQASEIRPAASHESSGSVRTEIVLTRPPIKLKSGYVPTRMGLPRVKQTKLESFPLNDVEFDETPSPFARYSRFPFENWEVVEK